MDPEPRNQGAALEERRAQQRYPLQLEVDLRCSGASAGPLGSGRTCDISATGLYVEAEAGSLQEGSQVQVNIHLPVGSGGGGVDLRAVGRVIRVNHEPGRPMGVAVTFDQIEFSADELESFT